MAHTEKELELEGHTLRTEELLGEASRLLDLARVHAMALRAEGVELKHITELDQVREIVLVPSRAGFIFSMPLALLSPVMTNWWLVPSQDRKTAD